MADRTVHCTIIPIGGGRIEIVRYDRSGKWFYESGATRRMLTLDEAAAMADDRPAVIWHEARAGGRMFDARVRRMRASNSRRRPGDAGREETDRG